MTTVSFHNFKSQNFKLSVSNPKNKYVDYLSVLSQNSNCESLVRKNKHEILKTGRIRSVSIINIKLLLLLVLLVVQSSIIIIIIIIIVIVIISSSSIRLYSKGRQR